MKKIKKVLAVLLSAMLAASLIPQGGIMAEETAADGLTGAQTAEFVKNSEIGNKENNFSKTNVPESVGNGTYEKLIGSKNGYYYVFETVFKSSAEDMAAFAGGDVYHPYLLAEFRGYGTGGAEQYFLCLYKQDGNWTVGFSKGTGQYPDKKLASYTPSDEQLAKISSDDGLKTYLTYNGNYTYTAYVECGGIIDCIGSYKSTVNNCQIYAVLNRKESGVGTSVDMTTVGYFYGTGYTGAVAAQVLLSNNAQPNISYTKFKSYVGGSGNSGDFSNDAYNGTKIDNAMRADGAKFLFHTKLEASADSMTAAETGKRFAAVRFDGWGSKAEQYFISLYKTGASAWEIRYYYSGNSWEEWLVNTYVLSDSQISDIQNGGIDVFLIKSDNTVFSAFIERDGVADLIGSVDSASSKQSVGNRKVYQIFHISDNTAVKIATTGYFFTSDTIIDFAAQGLLGIGVTTSITKSGIDTVVLKGLKESYKVGDSCEFTVENTAFNHSTVKINGTAVTPTADGVYKYAISKENTEQFDIAVDTQTFNTILKSDGTAARQIGAGTCSFADQKGNFIFHTKFKYSDILKEDGTVNYPETATILGGIQLYGYSAITKNAVTYSIEIKADSSSVSLLCKGEDDGWKEHISELSEAQILKMANDGLDIYFAHKSASPTLFSVFCETAEDSALVTKAAEYWSPSKTINNQQIQSFRHSTVISGATMVTTGYEFPEALAGSTLQGVCEAFEKATRADITVTNKLGDSELPEICHLGDILKFSADTAVGEYITVNGSLLNADKDGAYTFPVGNAENGGITVDRYSFTAESFNNFITLSDKSTVECDGARDNYIYRINYKSDLKTVTSGDKEFIGTTLYGYAEVEKIAVYDQIDLRLVLDDLSKPQLRLSRYKSGTDGGYSEQYYQLDENQIAKIKTAGLNAYIVHCGEDSTAYKLYVENGTSGAVKEYGTITAFSGTYQYKYQQRVVNGTHVTVEGFEYPDFANYGIAATELFWSDIYAVNGDANDDGATDIRDLVTAKKAISEVSVNQLNIRAADLDGNRRLNASDLAALKKLLLSGNAESSVQPLVYNAGNVKKNGKLSLSSINSELFYRNSVGQSTVYGADPSVFKAADGKYVMYVTGSGSAQTFPVYTSTDLVNWKESGKIEIVDENGKSAAVAVNKDIWAMEAIYEKTTKKYYLFFSATPQKFAADGSKDVKVPYVAVGDSYTGKFKLINHSDYKYADGTALSGKNGDDNIGYAEYLKYSVFDPYEIITKAVSAGKIKSAGKQQIKAIDFHPFVDTDGGKYLYFSLYVDSGSIIAGIKMNDWETPDYGTVAFLTENRAVSYERNNINEGPWMTEHNGKYYLTLSVNGYDADNYKVIQAVSDKPLGSFKKLSAEEGGVLLGADRIGEISGTGHHSFIEENGDMYIIYHVHDDPATPSYKRHIAMDKIEWVTNSTGETVMYANGPTLNSLQALPSFISGYSNIAPDAEVSAVNIKTGSSVSALTDKLINSKGSTWQSASGGANSFFNDYVSPDAVFSGETTINMTFKKARTVRAIMVYNAASAAVAFDAVKHIEFTCADGTVKYIDNLAFDAETGTYTLAAYQGETTGDEKFICGASAADFSELQVTSVKITVAPGADKAEVGIGEIVLFGK